jgi:hypothetical protein
MSNSASVLVCLFFSRATSLVGSSANVLLRRRVLCLTFFLFSVRYLGSARLRALVSVHVRVGLKHLSSLIAGVHSAIPGGGSINARTWKIPAGGEGRERSSATEKTAD